MLLRKPTYKENLTLIDIHPDERVDDLQNGSLQIIQNPSAFCFGTDAVLLAHFARVKSSMRILDLGTGTGILPLLLWGQCPVKEIHAIEIQTNMADMAYRSMQLNQLQDVIHVHCGDYRDAGLMKSLGLFDLIVANPPYHREGSGDGCHNPSAHIARFEVTTSLQELILSAAKACKPGGRFCLVHQPRRLDELFHWMQVYHFAIKRMRLVHPRMDKEATLVLLEAIYQGKPGLRITEPLFLYTPDGTVSPQLQAIYQGGQA